MLTPLASATFVTAWSYTQTSVWATATFSDGSTGPATSDFNYGTGNSHIDPTMISWGFKTGTEVPTPGTGPSAARSGLTLSNNPTTGIGTLITNSGFAPTVSITHDNNVISGAFNTLKSATLFTTLSITAYTPAVATILLPDITYAISFTETSNNGNCFPGSISNCDDVFVIDAAGLADQVVNYGGVDYTIGLFSDIALLLSDGACVAATGSVGPCFGFQTKEGQATTVNFGITISGREIPEPAPLALLGLGLFVLYLKRSRKNT